jgi:hypothetical protein
MYILILTLMTYNGGQAISTTEFNTKESCTIAANSWLTTVSPGRTSQSISAICAKR